MSVEKRSQPVDQGNSPDWHWRWAEILKHMRVIENEVAREELVAEVLSTQRSFIVAFVNAHAFNMAVRSDEFYQSLCAADVLLRDGIGVLCLTSLMGYRPGLNMNGTDFIPKLLQKTSGKTIALYGTCDPFLGNARKHAVEALGIEEVAVTTMDGFQPDLVYVQAALLEKPQVIVLGMGMPKQERIAKMLRLSLDYPCVIICGGAIIDFLGNRIKRAPLWVRKLGLEWLYRLILEPSRLFRRYVLGNPLFVARALWMRLH